MVNEEIKKVVEEIEAEMSKIVVGQQEVIRGVIRAILCNGHVLVEGVPGTAKTLIVKAMAKVMGCDMKRIQFTVDLLPSDLTGILSYTPNKGFEVLKGPLFTNFVIADEINRAPPKTQSALLEAMQEQMVTLAKKTYPLPLPFFVMATENPVETKGVYSLPEAQMDRFLFKLLISYPKFSEEKNILDENVTLKPFEDYELNSILSPEKIINLQKKVKEVFSSDAIKEYIVRIVGETRNHNFELAKYIDYGASPRASIALFIASKAEALINSRDYVIPEDVRKVVFDILRHRIILNYEAEAKRISTEEIIISILEKISAP
ncbi:MAG: MoxR family ATPase [archaeon]